MIDQGVVTLATLANGGATGIGFAAVFLVVRWFATFTAGRSDKKEAQLDGATDRLIAGLERRLTEEIQTRREIEAAMRAEMGELRTELAECNRKHAESEEEVGRLKGMILGAGDAREYAQLIVSAEAAERKDGGQ